MILILLLTTQLIADEKYYVNDKEVTKITAMKTLLNENENDNIMKCYQVKLSPNMTMVKK